MYVKGARRLEVAENLLLKVDPRRAGKDYDEGPEPESEADLVAKARMGDSEAFGELVRRSRSKAYGLAYSMTKDVHLAEDVVQEALVRAFLHLGTLMDPRSFKPWLNKIVRNEAYMKLRRGGPHVKESSFASLEGGRNLDERGSSGYTTDLAIGNNAEGGWYDIDRVLYRLSRQSLESSRHANDPSSSLLRKELIDGIRSLLHCLSIREKRIFQAYFFDQLSPLEIAALLDTSVANVYNSISRSRGKIQQERIRVHIGLYIEERKRLGKPVKKLLAPPLLKLH
jgi:RNA polymerase sigma factor (sigma-70 family)